MFLPSIERYSTVAWAPTASLPSTFVLSSTMNWTALISLFFATCTENSASPTEVICPDKDWFSGVGSEWPAARMGYGVDQAAIVKQKRNSVARHSEVRNRIKFPPIRFGPGPWIRHELSHTVAKFAFSRKVV